MNNREIAKRLNSMDRTLITRVLAGIACGEGAHSLTLITPTTLKQVNACFAYRKVTDRSQVEAMALNAMIHNDKHAPNWNGDDRTLCGDSDEGTPDENWTDAPVYAQSGELISCLECREVIRHWATFKRFKVP